MGIEIIIILNLQGDREVHNFTHPAVSDQEVRRILRLASSGALEDENISAAKL